MAMDVVDYKVYGAEMQFVEVELDPQEAAVGEAGSMFYMERGINMETIFGDGSGQQSGFLDKLVEIAQAAIERADRRRFHHRPKTSRME